MEIIVYPIIVRRPGNKPEYESIGTIEVSERWRLADSGTFLVGKNNWWHGGAHFKSKTDAGKNHLPRTQEILTFKPGVFKLPDASTHSGNVQDSTGILGVKSAQDILQDILREGSIQKDGGVGVIPTVLKLPVIHDAPPSKEAETFNEAVQVIAKGKIIAYRMNQEWQEQAVFKKYSQGKEISTLEKYSTSFVLVEHNMELPYVNLHDISYSEKLFVGYKFYSLYMHLTPISDLIKNNVMLPWFMCSQRKALIPQLNRAEEIILLNPADDSAITDINIATRNGLVYIKTRPRSADPASPIPTTSAPERKIWIPKRSVMRGKGSNSNKYYTVHQLGFYYEPAPKNVDTLNSVFEVDTIKVLSAADAIPVEAGDILGFPGGTIIDKKHVGGMFHFEVFAKNIDFIENIKAPGTWDKPLYRNTTEYDYYVTNKGDTTTNPFAAGEFYHHRHDGSALRNVQSLQASYGSKTLTPAEATTLMSAMNAVTAAGPEWANWYTIGSGNKGNPSVYTHFFFDGHTTPATSIPATGTNQFLEIYSDADWIKGPVPWKEGNTFTYVNNNGYKTSAILPSSTEKMIFKFHSEWSDDNVPARYDHLKNAMLGYDTFIEFVKKHCFWKEVKAVYAADFPDASSVYHIHPTSFIDQLARIMQPYYNAKPRNLQRYLDRHTNETLVILKKREDELTQWLGTSSNTDALPNGIVSDNVKNAFKTWFGYHVPAPITIGGVATQPLFVLPTTPFSAEDSRGNALVLPSNLTTVVSAIVWVRRVIHNMIHAIKGVITTSKYVGAYVSTANYANLYGYVYAGDDKQMFIHLAHLFLKQPANIDNRGDLYLYDTEPPESGVTVAHELSHFRNIGEMINATGVPQPIGLYDLVINYIDPITLTSEQLGPYGRDDCKDRAKIAPEACLCNADNFAYYVNFDVTKSYKDTFEYYE